MSTSRNSPGPIQYTEYGIPIRNLWHMLLYAWNEPVIRNILAHGEVESAPTLDTLFALVLTRSMQQRMRIGLGHAYVSERRSIRGLRGRVDFSESLKRHAFEQGQADCDFQEYSANEPCNRMIRTTLVRLIQTGVFGPDKAGAEALRHRLRWLVRNLDGIELIDLTPALIGRHLAAQNDHDYRLMLSVCALILERQMPLETEGSHPVPGLDRDALVLYHIYERFVANFYRMKLGGWEVAAQKRLDWHAQEPSNHLPSMIPDLVLKNKDAGQFVILDTKFSAGGLVENRWGKPVYDSSHLYQLYAYLRSQEHLSQQHRTGIGILLYPAVQFRFSETVRLQEQTIRIECVDLAAPWQEVERQLIEIVVKP